MVIKNGFTLTLHIKLIWTIKLHILMLKLVEMILKLRIQGNLKIYTIILVIFNLEPYYLSTYPNTFIYSLV